MQWPTPHSHNRGAAEGAGAAWGLWPSGVQQAAARARILLKTARELMLMEKRSCELHWDNPRTHECTDERIYVCCIRCPPVAARLFPQGAQENKLFFTLQTHNHCLICHNIHKRNWINFIKLKKRRREEEK